MQRRCTARVQAPRGISWLGEVVVELLAGDREQMFNSRAVRPLGEGNVAQWL